MLIPDPIAPTGERAKLVDFGIARFDAELHSRQSLTGGSVMGTPTYMSPEQCRGVGPISAKSDVYSLGVMLYQLLAGRPPFVSKGIGELLNLHMSQPPPNLRALAPHTPAALAELVHGLLAKDPEQRPSMLQVVAALEQMQAQQGTLGRPPAVASPPPLADSLGLAQGKLSDSLASLLGSEIEEEGTAASEDTGAAGRGGARWSHVLAAALVGGGAVLLASWLLPARPGITTPPRPAQLSPEAAAGLRQQGPPEYYASQPGFSSATPFATDKLPAAVAAGDFNGDGALDLVTANGQSSVSVLLGDGKGSFGAATTIGTYANASSVATGDFNGDKKLDLAVVTYGSNSVNILLGNGRGGFVFSTDLPGIGNPGKIAVADVNQDSILDLVVTSGFTNSVDVLLGNSKGGFSAATPFPTGQSPVAVAIADFDGDKKPDLVVGNSASGSVSVLRGDGRGSFAAAQHHATRNVPSWIVVGDFNRDGRPDLAVTNTGDGNVSVLLGDGSGGFGAARNVGAGQWPYAVMLADFDGDQQLDLAVAANGEAAVHVLLGDGLGGFGTAAILPMDSSPRALAGGDFNGDGKPDLATANYFGDSVSVILNQSQ